MTTPLRQALDRTLRLMRDHLVAEADDVSLVGALTDTQVVLVGDARNLSSHAAQCAYITAALLMARSGHRVFLAAPDLPLIGPQPPLKGSRLVSALLEIGGDLLPDIGFSVYPPRDEAGLMLTFGDSRQRYRARRVIAVNASAWSARLGPVASAEPWAEPDWPFGALAAGALASAEAFKVAMHELCSFAKDGQLFTAFFAFTDRVSLELAPATTPNSATLCRLDFLSGGAITNAAVYVLARLLGVMGCGRVIEPETADLSNMNRYLLLRRSAVGRGKAEILKSLVPVNCEVQAVPSRYQSEHMADMGDIAPSVLVGVDDIPIRWKVQEENPGWLGIGATTHWAAMASFHEHGLACARCLHPRDDPTTGPMPTVAFVSFFAGLTLASYFARMRAGQCIPTREQYTYVSPLRPERVWRSPVAVRSDCPTCRSGERVRAA
jgi:hypothetical protein